VTCTLNVSVPVVEKQYVMGSPVFVDDNDLSSTNILFIMCPIYQKQRERRCSMDMDLQQQQQRAAAASGVAETNPYGNEEWFDHLWTLIARNNQLDTDPPRWGKSQPLCVFPVLERMPLS